MLSFVGIYPSDVHFLYHNSGIEQSDDVHAELVEDEDEEVMLHTSDISEM